MRLGRRFISNGRALHPRVLSPRITPPLTSGQPLFETRPSLVKAGELTPGITALEYYRRRAELMSRLPSQSVVAVPSNDLKYASGAVFYKFHQNTDFYYLTGWNEPNSLVLLEKPTADLNDVVMHMFVPPKNENAEQWDGDRTGVEGARDIFNADEAYSSDNSREMVSTVQKILARNRSVYYDQAAFANKSFFTQFVSQPQKKQSLAVTLDNLVQDSKQRIRPLSPYITELRAIKSPAEIALMRKIGQKSGRAYNKAIAEKFQNERTLDAFLQYQYIKSGCAGHAYIPVVAGGSNALHIHYTRNDDVFHKGEFVLVDSAAEYGGYKIDISRTWTPLQDSFSSAQRDLYEAVLDVQKSCIALAMEGSSISLQSLHNYSLSKMTKNLQNIGFSGLTDYECSVLYPHYIGHNLGLDVHDVPNHSRHKHLQAGQVITVEPGVYVPDSSKYPKRFRNIGIRIEDDIAVGKTSNINLTVEAVKEIADMESIVQTGVRTHEEDEDDVEFGHIDPDQINL